jgi:hypothetical protein
MKQLLLRCIIRSLVCISRSLVCSSRSLLCIIRSLLFIACDGGVYTHLTNTFRRQTHGHNKLKDGVQQD